MKPAPSETPFERFDRAMGVILSTPKPIPAKKLPKKIKPRSGRRP